MMTELTPEQIALIPVYTKQWTAIGRSTDPANRPAAEQGVRLAYAAAGLPPPRMILWAQSLRAALLRCEQENNRAFGRSVIDRVWIQVMRRVREAVAREVVANLGDDDWVDTISVIATAVAVELTLDTDPPLANPSFTCCKGQHDAGTLAYYAFVGEVGGRADLIAPLQGSMQIAQNAGWFFPYEQVCIVCERHCVLHVDANGLLHASDMPAICFPDGWKRSFVHGVCESRHVAASLDNASAEIVKGMILSPSPGENTIAILVATLKQYDVHNNPDRFALFLAEAQGFSIYCTQQKTAAKFAERHAEHWDNFAFRDHTVLFVGRCRWLWSHDQQDVVGVRLRTDITPSESNITWGYADKRMAQQNRLHDIRWASERIEWLWRTALPSAPPPQIVVEDKIIIHKYVDWADFS